MSNVAKDCPRLSVAMIVRNAEDCLAASLDSVRNLADEIIVVDTGSHDSSLRIARQKATSVISHAWTDDFSAARNAALSAVTGDWVLWLDAGETMSPQTAESLRKFVDFEAKTDTAYFLLIRTPAQGANIAGEQVARVRLHPRAAGLTYRGRVRESLEASIAQLGMSTAGLSLVLERGPREHDAAVRQERAQRNLRLASQAIESGTVTPRLLNCLGEAAQALGQHAASVQHYRLALEQSLPGSSDMLEAYYGLLTALEGEENSREQQLQLCMQAIDTYPLDAQLLCAIGGYLQSKDHVDLASRAYQLSAEHGQLNLEIWHLDGLQEIATNCYASTLQLLGREDDAIQLLNDRLAEHPLWSRLRRQLIELHVRHARRDEALAVVNNMPRNVPNGEALRSAVRGACLAAGGNWLAARSYLETAYKAGCRDAICLRWLTATYLAAGDNDEASTMLEQWSRVDPLSPELRQYRQVLQSGTGNGRDRQLRVDEQRSGSIPAPAMGGRTVQHDQTIGR